jgi:hypothetical protein
MDYLKVVTVVHKLNYQFLHQQKNKKLSKSKFGNESQEQK